MPVPPGFYDNIRWNRLPQAARRRTRPITPPGPPLRINPAQHGGRLVRQAGAAIGNERRMRENLGIDPSRLFNNLLAFLQIIALRTKSMLLGTATPVQIHPIEAWDLLRVLSIGNEFVLGNQVSPWQFTSESLPVVMGQAKPPEEDTERWRYMRNPFPVGTEDPEDRD
ncbi:hypothetical protein JOC69_002310 [Heliobacterium gestii]|nr:hypothetical protein [Heliomicrobium gestii]